MKKSAISLADAADEQRRLADRVKLQPFSGGRSVVAAIDAAYPKGMGLSFAVAVVMKREGFKLVESSLVAAGTVSPYVPGFLSLREAPPLLEALNALKTPFEAVLVDGQGIAHPRGLGLASHIGVLSGLATVGCAKKRLVGDAAEPGRKKGSFSRLKYRGEEIGAVLRTRTGVKPLFVSPGHLTDVASARRITLEWVDRFRIPEPLRAAHHLAAKYSRALAPLLSPF